MITRITRGTLAPNTESLVFEMLRAAAQARPHTPGLVSMSISRRSGRQTTLVAVTVWEDAEAMAAVLGPSWQEPSWMPGLSDCIIDASVEMLETVATSVEAILELEPAN